MEPPILNHRELLRHGLLDSVAEIPGPVRRDASIAHRRLRRRLEELPHEPTREHVETTLARVADLLYVIRSNLQHGEKFASADPARIARDRIISEKAAAVIERFFDFLFARPSTSLAVYGSLARGGVHHVELDGIGGEWIQAVVRGQLDNGPFPRLVPTVAGEVIAVQLLRRAEHLHERWPRLDRLEGESYWRVLVAAETEDEELVIANLYAA
jgi:gamma-glutamylcyclotransferase (GGCT)/AIG2-like uncharacterized protein YtfP